MTDELAAANVNRSYQLAASSIAIFTFLLFFLYPRFDDGRIGGFPFQATLIVMGLATFSFAFASFYYYGASLGSKGGQKSVRRTIPTRSRRRLDIYQIGWLPAIAIWLASTRLAVRRIRPLHKSLSYF